MKGRDVLFGRQVVVWAKKIGARIALTDPLLIIFAEIYFECVDAPMSLEQNINQPSIFNFNL